MAESPRPNMHGGDAELTPCLTAAEVAAYIDHGLSQAERNRVEAHLANCRHCTGVVADVVRDLSEISRHL